MGDLIIIILLFCVIAGQIYWGAMIGFKLIDVRTDINLRLIDLGYRIEEMKDK